MHHVRDYVMQDATHNVSDARERAQERVRHLVQGSNKVWGRVRPKVPHKERKEQTIQQVAKEQVTIMVADAAELVLHSAVDVLVVWEVVREQMQKVVMFTVRRPVVIPVVKHHAIVVVILVVEGHAGVLASQGVMGLVPEDALTAAKGVADVMVLALVHVLEAVQVAQAVIQVVIIPARDHV